MGTPHSSISRRAFDPGALSGIQRYQLLTSLVVPRPIGWISTWSSDGVANLAPYSYFAALAASPMLVGVSVGHRPQGPKDTLVNMRARGAFCVNVVTEPLLEAMNATSAEVAFGVDEFVLAGLERGASGRVDAPYVAAAPAVLECRVVQEVALDGAPNTLVIGQVMGILVDEALPLVDGTYSVDPGALRPVGRLWGSAYAMPGEIRVIPRPRCPAPLRPAAAPSRRRRRGCATGRRPCRPRGPRASRRGTRRAPGRSGLGRGPWLPPGKRRAAEVPARPGAPAPPCPGGRHVPPAGTHPPRGPRARAAPRSPPTGARRRGAAPGRGRVPGPAPAPVPRFPRPATARRRPPRRERCGGAPSPPSPAASPRLPGATTPGTPSSRVRT
ncbi:MAG: flavin reductase family protein, partial [Gemmatimonadetes bacterium]|nr:flavin reductase family protein [Gemmatimonadota bacterium]